MFGVKRLFSFFNFKRGSVYFSAKRSTNKYFSIYKYRKNTFRLLHLSYKKRTCKYNSYFYSLASSKKYRKRNLMKKRRRFYLHNTSINFAYNRFYKKISVIQSGYSCLFYLYRRFLSLSFYNYEQLILKEESRSSFIMYLKTFSLGNRRYKKV